MSQPVYESAMPAWPAEDEALAGLVERARAGDRAAFAALFERYNTRICRYLARLVGDEDLGCDLAQDTFLAAWRGLSGIQDGARFGPWLYRIATNLARSHLRRARLIRWLPWGDAGGHAEAGDPGMAGPEEHIGEAEYVALALASMSPQCRTCLLLQIEGGFSQREVAQLLGISEKSVSAYISRGRQQFRQAYQRLESESEAAGKGGPGR
ncbi:MAG TPA: RNA polymerase sigma factor [Chloroflexota bacterium]|nr:RNA polymerase sigma factor [Chloroflexota bacterium]